MPGDNNKPWPWQDLQVEWLGTKPKEFPFILDFLRSKGIPENTGRKHTSGWQGLRHSLLQREAEKAVAKLEKETGSIFEGQGAKLAAILETSFNDFFECKRGKPVLPLKYKKEVPIELKARLFIQVAMLQQRLLAARLGPLSKVIDDAMFKTSGGYIPTEGEVNALGDNTKIIAILKNPKAMKHAEALMAELGGPTIDVANDQ